MVIVLRFASINVYSLKLYLSPLNVFSCTTHVSIRGKAKRILQCDLAGEKSIARVTLASMSAANKAAVDVQIEKTLKGKINREAWGTGEAEKRAEK
jgi:hypothetical protein